MKYAHKKVFVLLPIFLALNFYCFNAITSVLHTAVRNNDVDILRAALRHSEVRKVIDDGEQATGWTPLHLAIILGRVWCGKLLLNAGANPHAQDAFGKTPFTYALSMKDIQKAGLFIYRLYEADWNRRE